MPGGLELLKALKSTTTANAPWLSIPVGSPVEAILRPVATSAGRLNANDVRVLTEWRNRFVRSFLTQFEAAETSTETWLTEMVGPDPSRILFMLDDARGQTVGYLGLAFIDWEQYSGEADAIVRGAEVAPGVMAKAMFTLLDWAREQLELTRLSARVRSDNPALPFFLKIGTEVRRVSLRSEEEPGMIRWVEDESLAPSEPALVYIVFPSKRNPLFSEF
ncbi:MAG: GNAT family N-acetyltransferase [Pyrinomonadaceae bacterium]|nr:GNAT family N-acetyltransferase [Pyrinomonadaceae bacterium]